MTGVELGGADSAVAADGAAASEAGAPAEAATDRGTFEVWRQDDNGNRYFMSRHPDRASADAAVAAIEAGVQHKQLYWVTRAERN